MGICKLLSFSQIVSYLLVLLTVRESVPFQDLQWQEDFQLLRTTIQHPQQHCKEICQERLNWQVTDLDQVCCCSLNHCTILSCNMLLPIKLY